ncbi:DNA gyrase inhibitory protein [Trabulsiella guamensis ATCC 49490]|uniref:DNA gyrase inhibitor n=1 Tax=Trabulsiella guamensis ATCC 49490 TaxID=1005994 RepID=A0A084ZLG1_9ENTR|nr:DNA gyrase inhibitor SbmC [Trabulsiella guamensis]KFB98305.1 DNA gyrase inhibitory protein [Trabulsiella guamensis ATCC 49490]
MEYSIKPQNQRTIAGFHLVGPWEEKVKQGFEQLMAWVDGKQIHPLEWIAVYYDNPEITPPEKLRCDTAVTVPDDFTIPANSEGVMMTTVEGGNYAVARARVENNDFATPWYQFFESLQKDATWQFAPKATFEVYLNDGAVDGYWDIDMYVSVERK